MNNATMKKTNVQVNFPAPFSQYISNIKNIEFEGESIADFINRLDCIYGEIKERLFDEEGQMRPYLNIFIDRKNIRSLDGIHSKIPEGACISLLLSRAGG
jgi:molybdopterin converting factor small subunit